MRQPHPGRAFSESARLIRLGDTLPRPRRISLVDHWTVPCGAVLSTSAFDRHPPDYCRLRPSLRPHRALGKLESPARLEATHLACRRRAPRGRVAADDPRIAGSWRSRSASLEALPPHGGALPHHRMSSFRGLLQSAAAPNAELSRLRLAKPPPSKSGSLARTCGDGKGARLAFAPQVVQSLSPRLNHDLAAVLLPCSILS
jgi:hypothetical protein